MNLGEPIAERAWDHVSSIACLPDSVWDRDQDCLEISFSLRELGSANRLAGMISRGTYCGIGAVTRTM